VGDATVASHDTAAPLEGVELVSERDGPRSLPPDVHQAIVAALTEALVAEYKAKYRTDQEPRTEQD
jgi:hypothetical protein